MGDAIVDQGQQPRCLDELADARSTAPLEQRETFELGNPYTVNKDPNLLLPENMFPGFSQWLEDWWNACMVSLDINSTHYLSKLINERFRKVLPAEHNGLSR